MVTRAIENAQTKVEAYNFDIRKHVVEYDDVMNRQREMIYRDRDRSCVDETSEPMIVEWSTRRSLAWSPTHTARRIRDEWNVDGLRRSSGHGPDR